MTASCLYEGTVEHRRRTPRRHGFRYRVWMAYLDLAELPGLFSRRLLWSASRPALCRFRRADHLGPPGVPLDTAVRDLVAARTGTQPRGPIRLLTHLRFLGAGFNPISVYYCFDEAGRHLEWVVAEVTNTPWGELQVYVLDVAGAPVSDRGWRTGRFTKAMHVSPFLPMDMEYRWRLNEPGERLALSFACSHAGEHVLDAGVALTRREITGSSLRRAVLRHPPMPLVVIGGIYWQGLRLWLRGVPPHPHPPRGEQALTEVALPSGPPPPAALPHGAPPRAGVPARAATDGARPGAIVPADDAGLPPDRPALVPPLGPSARALDPVARRTAHALLGRLHSGRVRIIENGTSACFGDGAAGDPVATVRIHAPHAYTAVLSGSVGLGRSYVDGLWDCDDPVALLRVVCRNLGTLDRLADHAQPVAGPVRDAVRGLRHLAAAARRDVHGPRRNTLRRSRARVRAHYDMGNDLFAATLDETMAYSCAVFPRPGADLREASIAKMDLVCAKLGLEPRDHLLEIGTGWGSLAIHAARTRGCRVTTTTISREQYELATELVARAGLSRRVRVLHDDYRELRGSYDKVVSIEMVEAIGWKQLDTFFARCDRLLRPDGAMLLQAIVTSDARYRRWRSGGGLANSVIFPGGCIPSVEALITAAARSSDLRLAGFEDITEHYPPTLRRWRENFDANRRRLDPRRYDERFARMWTLYLAYCEAAFAERRISDVQMLLARPGWRASEGDGVASVERITVLPGGRSRRLTAAGVE